MPLVMKRRPARSRRRNSCLLALLGGLALAISGTGAAMAGDPAPYRLVIGGAVATPLSISLDELKALPQSIFRSSPDEASRQSIIYQGVLLRDLLQRAHLRRGAAVVVLFSSDGMSARLPLGYVMEGRLLLAHEKDGQALDPKQGGPLMAVPDDLVGYKWVELGWLKRIVICRGNELNP